MSDSTVAKEERTMAMVLTLCGFLGLVGIPLGHILGPLVVWLIKKDSMPFVDQVGREALNFQISYSIYAGIAALLIFVAVGIVLLPIVLIAWAVFVIVGAIKVNEGIPYRYPGIFRLIGPAR